MKVLTARLRCDEELSCNFWSQSRQINILWSKHWT
jgi:hypothetical protein